MFFIILCIIFCGFNEVFSQTLGLVVEEGDISVTRSKTQNRASLILEAKITQTDVLASFVGLTTLSNDWRALACFVGESQLKDSLYNALDPGADQLESLKAKYLHAFTYLGSGTAKAASNCILKMEMFNSGLLTTGTKQALSIRTGVSMTGSAADIFAKKDVLRAAADFALGYNNLIATLHSQIEESLSHINLLSEKQFPQGLRGEMDSLACLGISGSNYEQIMISKMTRGDSSLVFELETSEPEGLSNYTKMRAVLYDDVRLYLPENSLLVRAPSTSKLTLLLCEDILDIPPTCMINPSYEGCLNSLDQNDFFASLANCQFEYASDVIGLRVKNEGILIQGEYLSVFQGDNAVIQKPPLLITSMETITVSNLVEEIKFTPAINFTTTKIETTKLAGTEIASIKLRAYWKFFWSRVLTQEYLNYFTLILEAIFAPMTIAGLALSCRRRMRGKKVSEKKAVRKARKSNYRENMELLQAARSSRSSRR
jgi:hypothetical protein